MGLGGLVLGTVYLKGMRILMFQLSGFYYIGTTPGIHSPHSLLSTLERIGVGCGFRVRA